MVLTIKWRGVVVVHKLPNRASSVALRSGEIRSASSELSKYLDDLPRATFCATPRPSWNFVFATSDVTVGDSRGSGCYLPLGRQFGFARKLRRPCSKAYVRGPRIVLREQDQRSLPGGCPRRAPAARAPLGDPTPLIAGG